MGDKRVASMLFSFKVFRSHRIVLLLFAVAVTAAFLFGGLADKEKIGDGREISEGTSLQEKEKKEQPRLLKREFLRITYVIDGDTIELETGERVRLIGIDAPENGKPYFSESRAKLAELVLDKEVALEKDESDKDEYGRLLRYVYQGEVFINLAMVRLGYARVLIITPDVKYKDLLLAAEREVRREKRGIWSLHR